MQKVKSYFLGLSLSFFGLAACSESQDFDQIDALEVTPTVEASMLYVEAPERIINQLSGLNFIQETFNFDAFAEDFVMSWRIRRVNLWRS